MERRALSEWLRRLQKGVDFVLSDTADRAEADFSPLLPQPQRIVIAVASDGASITEAYARMKRLAQLRDCRRFGIAILRASSAAENRTVFANLREVARRHLGAELDLVGGPAGQDDADSLGLALAAAFLDTSRQAAGNDFSVAARGLQGAAAAYPVV
jgi:flagellar biosynthesis protein FlhG